MTLEEAKALLIQLWGFLQTVDGQTYVAEGEPDLEIPSQGPAPGQSPNDPSVFLLFPPPMFRHFTDAWDVVYPAALATGRTGSPCVSGPLDVNAENGINCVSWALDALGVPPARSPWPWVIGGLAAAGLVAAVALVGAHQAARSRPPRRHAAA